MRLYAAALCAALLSNLAAHAATITSYSSQGAFAAASSTRVIDNFSGITNYKFGRTYDDGSGIVFSLPFTTPIASTFYVFNNVSGYHNSVSASYAKYLEALGTPSSTVETLTFAPSSAIGFYLGHTFGASTINVLIDGTSYNISAPSGNVDEAFAGFTSTGTFSTVTLSVNNPQIDLVQVYLGTATPASTAVTPEPSSLALLGTGLVGMVGVLRKRLV